jgi:putative heme-binding domain-containing protein
MDLALLSSLGQSGDVVFRSLVQQPGEAKGLLLPLAVSIAASGNEQSRIESRDVAIQAAESSKLDTATDDSSIQWDAIVAALSQSPLDDEDEEFDEPMEIETRIETVEMEISDEMFRQYTAALAGPRDIEQGHQVFIQKCASCHQVGNEGHVVGPDLLGELGVSEETLVRHLLLPSERLRPGYETTLLMLRDETMITGILKEDGPTSLTMLKQEGVKQVVLKKNVMKLRRTNVSLMPSFGSIIPPAEMASLLGWLREQLH